MQKMLMDLTSGKNRYDYLLNNFFIKLFPMVNVDGVVIGNARSSLVGLDLNRRWTDPSPIIHPEIYYVKEELRYCSLNQDKDISIFCDLHGHNRKNNCFFYGCNKAAN